MEKKLTKAQEKELLLAQQAKDIKRKRLVEAVNNFWRDAEAMKRVAEIEGKKYDDKEEAIKLLSRYEELQFMVDEFNKEDKNDVNKRGEKQHTKYWKMWSWLRIVVRSYDHSSKTTNKVSIYNYETNQYDTAHLDILPKDAIWCDDIIWNDTELKLYLELSKEYGINKIYYTNASSGALEVITSLIKFGAKVIGTTNINEYRTNQGLIFDITEIDYSASENESNKTSVIQ